MKLKQIKKVYAIVCVGVMSVGASANSVGFDAMVLEGDGSGTIAITLSYDFTEFAMFGGGVDLVYDTSVIEFVSYTQAELPADAQAPASPVGSLTQPGVYEGAGIGTFEFFNGMTSAGTIGTFVFNIIGGSNGDTPCGFDLCLSANGINPFVSLAGAEVSAQLLGNGISTANVGHQLPVPAAVWFMLSGLGALVGFGRK